MTAHSNPYEDAPDVAFTLHHRLLAANGPRYKHERVICLTDLLDLQGSRLTDKSSSTVSVETHWPPFKEVFFYDQLVPTAMHLAEHAFYFLGIDPNFRSPLSRLYDGLDSRAWRRNLLFASCFTEPAFSLRCSF